jgi:hypothetical protein
MALQLALLQNDGRFARALSLILNLATKDLPCDAFQIFSREGFDMLAHLLDSDLVAVNLDLASEILEFNHA